MILKEEIFKMTYNPARVRPKLHDCERLSIQKCMPTSTKFSTLIDRMYVCVCVYLRE